MGSILSFCDFLNFPFLQFFVFSWVRNKVEPETGSGGTKKD